MIFKGETGFFAVSPFLGLIVFIINAPVVWLVIKKVSEAIDREPDFNPVKIVNMEGVARTNIAPEGTVYVNGEEWSARSDQKILIGSKIKVTEKEGLVLIVEELA
jgi:membrane-bound serine protease (ClpP class)